MSESVRVASANLTCDCPIDLQKLGGNGATSGEFNCEHTVGLIIRPFQGEAFGAWN